LQPLLSASVINIKPAINLVNLVFMVCVVGLSVAAPHFSGEEFSESIHLLLQTTFMQGGVGAKTNARTPFFDC